MNRTDKDDKTIYDIGDDLLYLQQVPKYRYLDKKIDESQRKIEKKKI